MSAATIASDKATQRPEPSATQGSASGLVRERLVVRLASADKQRAQYWADKHGFSSANEYVAEAVAEQIRRENLDYDLPTMEIARLNELVDQVTALSTNVANLERIVTHLAESLIQLTRGDNYLTDAEDGELP